ncbi:MAG: response regulator transcription factor [Planctomycetota bacterium]
MRILLVEDDADFRTTLRIALASANHDVSEAPDAELALDALRFGEHDLVLLDLELPERSGFDVIHDVREAGDELPIIVISGREGVEDRVKALRLGADDYLTKPIHFEELEARIEAVMRRRTQLAPVSFGDLHFDLARRRVTRNGKPCWLSPREYDLLFALARADGEAVTRKDLLNEVWDISFDPGTNVLDVHIGRVRKKVDRHGRPLIETVRGVGYKLVKHSTPA